MKVFLLDLTASRFIRSLKPAKMIATLAMLMAMSIVANMFLEFKMFDTQFSLTIAVSAFVGLAAGPLTGFLICFIGDLIGFLVNPGGVYMFWIGLSTGCFALIAGLLSIRKAKSVAVRYLKVALFCVISFSVCTIGINSLGFYLYNMELGFMASVKNYVLDTFGREEVTFFGYVLYRLIFKMQILNSVFNYAVVFGMYSVLRYVKPLDFLFKE